MKKTLTIIAVVLCIGLFSCGDSFSAATKCHDGIYLADSSLSMIVKEKMIVNGKYYAYVFSDGSALDRGFDVYTWKNFDVGDTIIFSKK